MATPDVPWVIVGAWGALLYAAMAYSDSLAIPRWMRPAADGLYALMLDLTMDLVAVRLGLWTWETPADAQWFGIPYSNFGGWLVLAVLFSAGVRAVRAVAGSRGLLAHAAWLVALLAVLPLATMTLLGRLFTGTERDVWPMGLMALMAVVVLIGGLIWRRQATPAALQDALAEAPPPAGWVNPAVGLPPVWHLSYLGIGILTGVLTGSALLFLTGAMAAIGTLLVLGLAPLCPAP